MRKRIAGLLGVACAGAVLASAPPARAQDTHDVVIRLYRKGTTTPIPNAPVTIDHTIDAGNTDSAGTVKVEDLPDGGHIVEAIAFGYESMFDTFKSGAGIVRVDLEMVPVAKAAKVQGQATDLRVAGFEGRRAKGVGKFFTRAQLDAATGRPLANVLGVDAGAYLASRGSASFLALEAASGGASPCYAAVVRDGLRIYPYQSAGPPDLEKIFAEQLTGVEFYRLPAQVPAELRDASQCGALVIWTRDEVR